MALLRGLGFRAVLAISPWIFDLARRIAPELLLPVHGASFGAAVVGRERLSLLEAAPTYQAADLGPQSR